MAAPPDNNGNPQLEFLFKKNLGNTDATTRLVLPSGCFDVFIGEVRSRTGMDLDHTSGNSVPFQLLDPNNRVWDLLCFTRPTGRHLKPVISGQWLQFVRANDLRQGDTILFYKNPNLASQAAFIVRFVKAT